MNEADFLAIAREGIVVTLQVAGPIMMICLVTGVLISLFQAMSSIQEPTLTFVPKILVMFVSLLVLLPFMFSTLETFTQHIMDRIISLG
jgi:flagellar biosynthetic protein FliQ